MKLHFIVNPAARNGKSLSVWKKVERYLASKNVQYLTHYTKRKGEGKLIVESILSSTEEPCFLIAVGGDGTVNEVINGAVAFSHSIVGYIRAGSGNDFSRGFEIPKDPFQAVDFILETVNKDHHYFDAGEFHLSQHKKGYFISSLGCGFDAAVAKAANHSKAKAFFNKLYLGKLVYVFLLLRELFKYKPSNLLLEIDQQQFHFENTWFVTVCNQPFFGGGMKIAPPASPMDGKLNVIVVHRLTRLKLLLLFITVFKGSHLRLKEVEHLEGKHIKISFQKEVPIHADGEEVGYTPIEVCIKENAQKIVSNYRHDSKNILDEL